MKKFFAWWVVTTVLVSAMCVALYWVEYFTADVVNPASAEFFSLFSFYWLLMYPGLVAIYWAFRFVFRKEEIER